MGKKLKKENTPKQVPTLFDSSLKEIFVCSDRGREIIEGNLESLDNPAR